MYVLKIKLDWHKKLLQLHFNKSSFKKYHTVVFWEDKIHFCTLKMNLILEIRILDINIQLFICDYFNWPVNNLIFFSVLMLNGNFLKLVKLCAIKKSLFLQSSNLLGDKVIAELMPFRKGWHFLEVKEKRGRWDMVPQVHLRKDEIQEILWNIWKKKK